VARHDHHRQARIARADGQKPLEALDAGDREIQQGEIEILPLPEDRLRETRMKRLFLLNAVAAQARRLTPSC
jgi:hypothetical protein